MDNPVTELHIEGYRSLKDVTWRLGSVNVVIGPNASGKSNLLKALSLITASAKGRLQDFIDEDGGMGSILWNHSGNTIAFRVLNSLSHSASTTYEVTLVRLGQTASYRIANESLSNSPSQLSQRNVPPEIMGQATVETELSRLTAHSTNSGFPNDADSHGDLLSSSLDIKSLNSVRTGQSSQQSWLILDDLTFNRTSKARRAVTARYIDRLDSDGGNLSSVLHTLYTSSSEFREQIKDAMFAAFGNEFVELVFPPAGGQTQIQLAIQWRSIKNAVTTTDLSDGTLRFLAIIAALAHPNPGAIIAVDEPETGLHPRMMRIIAEYARNAALKSQVIFTTHSAAFLDAFDQQDPPATTVVEMEDGATSVRTLDPYELHRWLSEYTLGSLYASMQLDQISAGASAEE